MKVLPIKPEETRQWFLQKHYMKRMPLIMFAYGLYEQNYLIGVVTYGAPASPHLARGVCGEEHALDVLELNRLCLERNEKNFASILVSRSIKLLPPAKIIVSYADTKAGHVGYVYQATNFLYTGLSAKRKDPVGFDTSGGGKHSRGKWGKDLIDRPRKHRYITFTGDRRQKKNLRHKLRYDVLPYPKGESKTYDAGDNVETQRLLF
tara:strand:- start:1126 stop:1743 length:618 start_codon:yes stop_codon:yes gene_type:complete